jgi:hypothetical protein
MAIICSISARLRAACSSGVVAQAVSISAASMVKLRMIVSFDDAPRAADASLTIGSNMRKPLT